MELDRINVKREQLGETQKTSLDPIQNFEVKAFPKDSGCTACAVLVTPNNIYCANVGDSRAIIATQDGDVIVLSHDHKPNDPTEEKRIIKAGGTVDQGRLNG